jgi:hypothetical protein
MQDLSTGLSHSSHWRLPLCHSTIMYECRHAVDLVDVLEQMLFTKQIHVQPKGTYFKY